MKRLFIILGDQLDRESAIFDDFNQEADTLWMAETTEETEHVWCHKLRIAFFFSCMRHFRNELREQGYPVLYRELPVEPSNDDPISFHDCLIADCTKEKPEKILVVHPGDFRVLSQLQATAENIGIPLEILEDRHFYSSPGDFAKWAEGKKSLLMENFYRHMRKSHKVLLTADGDPLGGEWNFDKDNRESFGKSTPETSPLPEFPPDAVTQDVIALVEKRFAGNPGSLAHFDLPVTREDALAALKIFIKNRLPDFGKYQDAMWEGRDFLSHSRLSPVLNVKLINPRETVATAVTALEKKEAPVNSVEGFVRQIIGWREYVRGIYWLKMPDYAAMNFFDADETLPAFFWDGDTDMACVRDAMRNVIRNGYAHHIQRLMVLGLFSQIYGADPYKFHEWHMAMYLDAIDWVSLPNTLGMSQFGDGGIVGTKPYCASGNYIHKMGNYCKGCRYQYNKSTGDDACPFTTFYWDFLARNEEKLRNNHRMAFQMKNLDRKRGRELEAIQAHAESLRAQMRPK